MGWYPHGVAALLFPALAGASASTAPEADAAACTAVAQPLYRFLPHTVRDRRPPAVSAAHAEYCALYARPHRCRKLAHGRPAPLRDLHLRHVDHPWTQQR